MEHCVTLVQRLEDDYAWYAWLKNEMGIDPERWQVSTEFNSGGNPHMYLIYFAEESDAIWFSLTWL